MAGCWTKFAFNGISILGKAGLDERRKALVIRAVKELVLNESRLDKVLDCIHVSLCTGQHMTCHLP